MRGRSSGRGALTDVLMFASRGGAIINSAFDRFEPICRTSAPRRMAALEKVKSGSAVRNWAKIHNVEALIQSCHLLLVGEIGLCQFGEF